MLCGGTGATIRVSLAAQKSEGLLSCAGWGDCAVLCEGCDAAAPEGRTNILTVGL